MLKQLTALEFYSGIGGMHYALQRVAPNAVVLDAFDVNHAANSVYQHNFGKAPQQVDLVTMTAAELDKYAADLWLMAPPCQPFTRQGKQLGGSDARSSSFMQLLGQLQLMQQPPQHLLLENVVGFQHSDVHAEMVAALTRCAYHTQEFILTPLQYGVPYSRPRYFCIASKQALPVALPQSQQPCQCTPAVLLQLKHQGAGAEQLIAAAQQQQANQGTEVPTLGEYLSLPAAMPPKHQQQQQHEQEEGMPSGPQEPRASLRGPAAGLQHWVRVPDAVLDKHADVIDVVSFSSRSCNCFTKAYGHFARGTGSLLATVLDPAAIDDNWRLVGGTGSLELRGYQPPQQRKPSGTQHSTGSDMAGTTGGGAALAAEHSSAQLAAAWKRLGLRYFTPYEIAQLHSFPPCFGLPPSIGCKQAYQLLGNSLSMAVVSDLLAYLLAEYPTV